MRYTPRGNTVTPVVANWPASNVRRNHMDVVQIITSIGFPAFTFIACAWYINKQTDSNREDLDKLRTELENNTEVLAGLKELLEHGNK